MADNIITSVQNPKVKKLVALQQKSSERRKEELFVVEGRRELMHCLEAGYDIDSLFICAAFILEVILEIVGVLAPVVSIVCRQLVLSGSVVYGERRSDFVLLSWQELLVLCDLSFYYQQHRRVIDAGDGTTDVIFHRIYFKKISSGFPSGSMTEGRCFIL